jgi:Major Facilitator Superfamily
VFATFFFVSLYLQQILGYRPLRAGAAFLPFSAGIATGATVARKLVPRLGVHVVPVIGLALATAGMIVLTQLPVDGRYVSNVLPGVLPLGLGMGLTFVPITLAGTSEVTGEDAGLASGLLNTAQQVGGSIGLAVLSTLAASRTTSLLHGPATLSVGVAARVSGFHVAFIAAAVLLAVAWTIAALQLRPRRALDAKRVEVPRDLAAAAVGCAQCAPVAVAGTRGGQTTTSADDIATARHR